MQINAICSVRFQVLTAASMKFRIVFWDVVPCKIIFDDYFTRQYIPEDNSEEYAVLKFAYYYLKNIRNLFNNETFRCKSYIKV
jgi:hypothetical protein